MAESKSVFERRRQKRVKAKLPMRLAFRDNEALATTNNISMLGACVDANKQIAPGTRVAVSVDIPPYAQGESFAGEIRGEGAIVRCDPKAVPEEERNYEVGVFFANFPQDGEEKLSRYLDYLIEKEEQEVREWVQQYRARMDEKKRKIAEKKKLLAKKRAARLARRRRREAAKAARMKARKAKKPRKNG